MRDNRGLTSLDPGAGITQQFHHVLCLLTVSRFPREAYTGTTSPEENAPVWMPALRIRLSWQRARNLKLILYIYIYVCVCVCVLYLNCLFFYSQNSKGPLDFRQLSDKAGIFEFVNC